MNIDFQSHSCLYRQKGLSCQAQLAGLSTIRQKVYIDGMGQPDFERNKKYFSVNFAKFLKEKGVSKQFVAKKLKVHWDTVNKWAKGERIPSLERVIEIADLLGVSIDDLLKPPAPEPFPGFEDVMSLPAKERYFKVWQLAAEHLEITAPPIHNLGDPFFRDRVPKLETKEEVIQVYQEARTYWEGEVKRMEAELRKRGLLPPEEKEITKVEIKKEKKEKSEQKSPSNWSDNSNWSNNLEKTK